MKLADLRVGEPITVTLHGLLLEVGVDCVRIGMSGRRIALPITDANNRLMPNMHINSALVLDQRAAAFENLSRRERQVLDGVAHGMTNAEIGLQLYVTEDTVKTHMRRLFRKVGARDRAHLVAIAVSRGILHIPDGHR